MCYVKIFDLFKASVRTITDATCSQTYGSTPLEIVCATPVNGGGTCNGDSGGFVGSSRSGRFYVDGVVSFGRADGCEFVSINKTMLQKNGNYPRG